ncbi:Lycopene beta-cyclase [Alteripontixanthobacter maritimus]|uniref:Lycopene beta-cyclase n=1 Tax=Alteripontixanthobacter maritimus TaxID=2161824 RepID=A0A369QCR8_9SPHN|nr:lycopene beta-cyclase CrtY [Alteripontixanthobacter maritimus]RDC60709.1 Lycopene beta-cyclase [Alteripontixanthobacter maritimus]
MKKFRKCDMAIIGGGLSGGLIALAAIRAHPKLDIALIEAGETLGGNHRWSWFESDLDPAATALLAPFRKTEWDTGYDVRFPAYARTLDARYRSLASEDFDAALQRELNQGSIVTGQAVTRFDASGLTLADGSTIDARTVIDCRGISDAPELTGGWQVFMGRHMRTAAPHGLDRPIIMDATVAQHGAYRFVYVLPLGANEVFIEDTYYADEPALDRRALGARIEAYAKANGWDGEIIGNETGVLPVITGGDFGAFQQARATPGVALAGARGGFVHPLTSYTLAMATRIALLVANNALLPGDQLAALLAVEAKRHWQRTGFYRLLGNMLFGAAEPDERYRVFERFYRLRQPLIERFYAANSTFADKARILSGRPPVPVSRAIGALVGARPNLIRKITS